MLPTRRRVTKTIEWPCLCLLLPGSEMEPRDQLETLVVLAVGVSFGSYRLDRLISSTTLTNTAIHVVCRQGQCRRPVTMRVEAMACLGEMCIHSAVIGGFWANYPSSSLRSWSCDTTTTQRRSLSRHVTSPGPPADFTMKLI